MPLLALLLLAAPAPTAALAETPVAAYSFDEGSGEVANDSAGEHDGDVDGPDWTSGRYGGGLDFNAEGDRVKLLDHDELDFTDAFTLEAWIRPDQYRQWDPIILKAGSGEPNYSYLLYAGHGEGGPPKAYIQGAGEAKANAEGKEALPLDTWTHLATTSDGEELKLYVDGELVATKAALTAAASSHDVRIGGHWEWAEFFDGKVDEVRLYDQALSEEEIEADMETPIGPAPEPVAAYSFDEGTGKVAYDSAGEHDGDVDGPDWTSGRYGGGLDFNAEGDRVKLLDHDELDFTDAFTLEAWIRPDQYRQWDPIILKAGSGTPNYSYLLYAGHGEGGPPKAYIHGAGEAKANAEGTEALPLDAWTHLATTSDGEELKLYVDGELVATKPALTAATGSHDVRIGGHWEWAEFFDGKVDEVRLYDQALSEVEIEGDMGAAISQPVVGTGAATKVKSNEATLNATVDPNGLSTTFHFEYGTTTSYGSKAPAEGESAGSGADPVAVSKGIAGLQEGTTYHYRVVAANAAGSVAGEDKTLTTLDPPETTIDSTTPTYTAGEQPPPIEFSSDEAGSTYKCGLDVQDDVPTESCTSPYTLPAKLSDGWHTFVVAATDSEGNLDPTPARWMFNTGIYPSAPSTSKLSSPEEGRQTSHYFTLQAEWGSTPEGGGVTDVTFQLKLPYWKEFRTIPAEYVFDGNGEPVTWPLPVTDNPGHTEPLYFDYRGAVHAKGWVLIRSGIKLRAVFDGGKIAAGASEPATTEFIREYGVGAPTDAVESVGPVTLDLLTGQYTMSRTDVSIPVPGSDSSLEFTRVYESSYVGQKVPTKTLGGAWQPSAPVEQAAEGAMWTQLVERHENAVPPVYDEECWEENGKKECDKWMVEDEIPPADWVEIIDSDGAAISFEVVGGSYVSPEYAKEYTLTKNGSTFALDSPEGSRTVFTQNGSGSAFYRPTSVSWQATAKSARMVYEHVPTTDNYRLIAMIAPAGVTCTDQGAMTTAGCRSLTFQYSKGKFATEDRLTSITYHNSTGQNSQVVAEYAYSSGKLIKAWDPRISPALEEVYEYSPNGNRLLKITPPGEEPWEFKYYGSSEFEQEKSGFYNWRDADLFGRLKSVSRASLLESPATAQTTIAYQVPLSGEEAPYDMSAEAVAQWDQSDYPVDATAIFPATEVPDGPRPSDYAGATVYYLDPEGYLVNTASAAPPGVEGDAITTSETDTRGNVVRELSAQNRLDALQAEDPVARSHELDSHSTYSPDGTKMLESWGPLHEVRLESGETVEARAHTTVEYDKGAPELKEGESAPRLPTKETVGADIPGKETDADVRVSETEYDWDLRKPTATIVNPKGLNLRTVTVYDKGTGLVTETRLPAEPKGGDARSTKYLYYSALDHPDGSCGKKPEWANLPCKTLPAAQPSGSNPKLLVTRYASYSNLDQPTSVIDSPGGEEKEGKTRTATFTYDSAGRPIESKSSGGGAAIPATETIYDELTGRPVVQQFVCEEEECGEFDTEAVTTTYDTLGRPVEYEDAHGNVSETAYDLLGRPVVTYDGKGTQIRTFDPDSGALVELEDSAAGTFTASYDADGSIVAKGLPNGLTAETTYDEAGVPIQLSYEKTTGCSSNCTWLEFSIEESVHGQWLKQESTLSTQEYAYDEAGRLIQVKDTPDGEGCTTRSYSFDANSNRTKLITRSPGEGGACDTKSKGTTQEYSYDTGDRLIGEGIEYDNFGRITELPGEYAGGGKLTSSFYTNDLTHSQTQDGITNTYELDAALRQRERTRTGPGEGTEVYHYAGGSDSPAWIDRGETWERSVEGIEGDLAAIQDSKEGTTLQLSNLHGDIVATASLDPEAKDLLDTFEFDEFGNPKQEGGPRYGWLGGKQRRTELPSGVIQMGVRSYVPSIGRFLSVDSVIGGSANSYDYANGDPCNEQDLDGRRSTKRRTRHRGAKSSFILPFSVIPNPGPTIADKARRVWKKVKSRVGEAAAGLSARLSTSAGAVYKRAIQYAINTAKGGARTAAAMKGWIQREFTNRAHQLVACGTAAYTQALRTPGPWQAKVGAAAIACAAAWRS